MADTQTKVTISLEDRISGGLDQIQKRLGFFNKEGLAMGVSFALINKGMELLQAGFRALVDYVQKGVEMNRKFELSMVNLGNMMKDFDKSTLSSLKGSLQNLSIIFAQDINTMVDGLKNFIREGYNASESLSMMYSTMKLVAVSGEDLAAVQETVNTVMQTFDYEAESTSYVMEKLSAISSITNQSISSIGNTIGMSADKVRTAGLSFDDLVSIFYAIEESGIKGRAQITKFKEILESPGMTAEWLSKSTYDEAILGIETLDEKYQNVADTVWYTAERVKELNKQAQINIGGVVDTGGWEAGIIEGARITADEYIKNFGDEAYKKLSEYGGVLAQSVRDVALAMIAQNMQQEEMIESSPVGVIQRLDSHLNNLRNTLDSDKASLMAHNQNITDMQTEMEKNTAVHGLNQDIRYMSMALEDSSYSMKITNSASRELIDSIRRQREAIQELQHANDLYSISANVNNLAIMKIQYEGMGRRRGLTKAEERAIKELERANLELRISTTENQIAMDEVKLDLSADEERYNKLKMWYDEELYTVQSTYAAEQKALADKILLEAGLMEANAANIARINAQILQNEIDTYYARMEVWRGNPGGAARPTIPGGAAGAQIIVSATQAAMSGDMGAFVNALTGHQGGGHIYETGPYLLHRGETVMPAGGTHNSYNQPINIVVNAVINKDMDVDSLARSLRSAISKNLLTSAGLTNYRMR